MAGLAISGLFLAAALSRVELQRFADAWATTSVGLLVVAAAISLAEVSVRALRWLILLRPMTDARYRSALAYLSIGHLANAVLPARLGDVARAFLAGGRFQASRATVLGTIVVERIADAGLLAIAVISAIVLGFTELGPAMAWLAIAGLVGLGIVGLSALVLGRRAVAATRVGALIRQHAMRFAAGAVALRRPASLGAVGALTALSFALAVALMQTVGSAVGLSLETWQAALVIAAVTLSTAVPAGPASLGTYEFVGVSVMVTMGHPAEQSLLAVAMVHAIATLVPAGMGLGAMWSMGIRSFVPAHGRSDRAQWPAAPAPWPPPVARPLAEVSAAVDLTVVIPAHNSGALIAETVGRLAERLAGTRSEIIVVENGSTDETFDRCNGVLARWTEPGVALVVLKSERGMGNALRTGVLASRGASVLLTADDLPFGFDDLEGVASLVAADGQPPPVVIGSKAHSDSVVERGPMRAALTWGFGVMRRLLLGMRTGDPQGTFIVDGKLVRQLAHHATESGFLFTTELALILERLGHRPVEVPVRLERNHRAHESRVSTSDGLVMAIGLVRLRSRHRGRWQTGSISVGRPTLT